MPGDAVVVVDASAFAALLFGEEEGPRIADRLEGRELFAPTLLRSELAGVCVKKVRRHGDHRPGLIRALDLSSRLGVREVQVSPRRMVETAERTGLTAYDAAYLVLAEDLGGELVTLDERLEEEWRG